MVHSNKCFGHPFDSILIEIRAIGVQAPRRLARGGSFRYIAVGNDGSRSIQKAGARRKLSVYSRGVHRRREEGLEEEEERRMGKKKSNNPHRHGGEKSEGDILNMNVVGLSLGLYL